MINARQIDDIEQLFVRSCLECSPQPGDLHPWLPYESLHSGGLAFSQLCELKNQLLHAALETPAEVLPPKKICGLANQAAKLAWDARFPVLVFPCMFEEVLRQAREQYLGRQAGQSHEPPLVSQSFSL